MDIQSDEQRPGALATIMGFAGPSKLPLTVATLLATVSTVAGVLPYFLVARLLTDTLGGTATVSRVALLAATAVAAYVLKALAYGTATLVSHRATYSILSNIRSALSDKLTRSPMGYLTQTPSGSVNALITDDTEKLEYPMAHAIPEVVSNVLAFIIIAICLFGIDWRVGLAALVTIPIGLGLYVLMMAGRSASYREYAGANALLGAAAVEYVAGIQVVKMFGQSDAAQNHYRRTVEHARNVALRWFRHCWPYLAGFTAITPASITLVLPVAAWLYADGRSSLYSLILAVLLSLSLVTPLLKVVEFSENLATISSTCAKINDALGVEELPDAGAPVAITDPSIEFTDVRFGYRDREILHGVSFTCEPRTVTALVGPSGAGKSTIVRLLMRFWDPSSGTVRISGVNEVDIPVAQLMDSIAYVAQENYLFDGSIRVNIRMGRPSASDEEVIHAAEQAGCAEIARRLPEGYDSPVGEGGKLLSGGERQRIAIARALIKDAPIVVLDEATASTDPASEHTIQQGLSTLARGRTLIIVAHRLATTQHADQILLIDDGLVAARGSHEELMRTSPGYRRLWDMSEGSRALKPHKSHTSEIA